VRVPLGLIVAVAVIAAGCEDIRRFEGEWQGTISGDPAHQQGFGAGAPLHATVIAASRRALQMNITLPDQPALSFEPIRHAADDALGELRLDGEPLRTFLGYLRPTGQQPYLTVVSLFAEDRIDVRLIRGPDESYGVFSLRRPQSRTP
jgi:hypothetical protein